MIHLHLVRLPLDLRAFTSWALRRRYLDVPPGDGRGRPREADLGYALHAALAGLFGEQAPRPFAFPPMGQRERRSSAREVESGIGVVDLLGYARVRVETLKTLAQLDDGPVSAMIDWDRARSRSMPTSWSKDMRLRFDLRACPVRRLVKPLVTRWGSNGEETTLSSGREVDAYQLAAARARERNAPVPSRNETYIEWLVHRLAARGGRSQIVTLGPGSARVDSYRSVRLLRRPRSLEGTRAARWLTRPTVQFTGLLEIVEPSEFMGLLARGIGRHCGFGFGMLLLRPA